jgi:hypothetical protein
MIATGAAIVLDVQTNDCITHVHWDDWLKLPVRDHDNAVNTPRGPVRVPTVIVPPTMPRCCCAAPALAPSASGSATEASANTPAVNSRRKKATSTTSSRAPAAAKRPGTTASSPLPRRELAQSQPPPARSRPAPCASTGRATRSARKCADPQPPQRARFGALPRLAPTPRHLRAAVCH